VVPESSQHQGTGAPEPDTEDRLISGCPKLGAPRLQAPGYPALIELKKTRTEDKRLKMATAA